VYNFLGKSQSWFVVANQAAEGAGKKSVAFEKARFEVCARRYEREAGRKGTLEKKSRRLLLLVKPISMPLEENSERI